MACLPNCGVLDLTSIRPRRAQDLIFHSMNLTPAAQYAHSGSCQAGLAASGSTHEVRAIHCSPALWSSTFFIGQLKVN